MVDDLFNLLWEHWRLVIGLIIIIALGVLFAKNAKPQSNLEKFYSIDIDLIAAGIYEAALQQQFMKDPLACRQEVIQHKRKRFLFITARHEKNITDQFVSEMKRRKILFHDDKTEARCNAILSQLANVMPENFAPPKAIYILDTPAVNACCLPDGTIVVFRGLIESFNDDELAWVIAHELGHGIAHHTAEMLSKTMVQKLAIKEFTEKDSNLFKIVGSHIAAFITNLKYSRIQENEADRLALFYMNKAGFNMQGAVTTLNKFKKSAGSPDWTEWLSTHPHPEKRLKNVEKAITQLEKDPDHVWGGMKDILLEKAKVKAIEIYLKKKNSDSSEEQIDNDSSQEEALPAA